MSSDNGHMLDAALAYAAAGLQVAACAPRSKVPLGGTNGVYSFTNDPGQLRHLWTRFPQRNVAVAIPEGYVVLDLDGPGAVQWWLDQVGRHGPLFTRTAKSSRGQHLWFRTAAPVEHQAALVEGDGWHVEVRTAGGRYMVMPPSVHPSGPTYSWLDDRGAAEAPPWLIELLATTKARPAAWSKSEKWDGKPSIPVGRHHDELVAECGRLRRQGHDDETCLFALVRWGHQHLVGPGSDHEEHCRSVVYSTAEWQEAAKRTPKIKHTEDGMPPGAPLRNVGDHTEPDFGRPVYGGRIVQSDPPIYLWSFEGVEGELELSSLQMEAWGKVRRAFVDRFHSWPNWSPPGDTQAARERAWLTVVRNWLQVATPVEVPRDLTVVGVVAGIFEKFLERANDDPGVLLRGGPWVDAERAEYVFKTGDLLNQARAEWPPEWRTQRSAAQQVNEVLRERYSAYFRNVAVKLDEGGAKQVRTMAVPFAAHEPRA